MTTLKDIQARLLKGDITMSEVVEGYIQRIDDTKEYNVYVEVFESEIREKAKALDDKIKNHPDQLGRMFGAVASIKDVICYQDHKVTAGSKILENFESKFTATFLQRGIDEDMLVIGRVNCDEFAMGSSNEKSIYGPTYNGADINRVPGGSSGASAVSVQLDTCLVSFGSDTGGSVRQPAAFCGLYGLKPTYGRISRYGLIAYASSFDQIGILSKDLDTVKTTLDVVEGFDEYDATTVDLAQIEPPKVPKSLKIAYLPSIMNSEALAPMIKKRVEEKIEMLQSKGHQVEPVDFDMMQYLVPCYYVLTTAEASSNLARYDGIRYGHRTDKPVENIDELITESRNEGLGLEVKRRIIMGTFVLSVGFFDAYFNKAQKVRQKIKDRMTEILSQYDYVLLPSTTDVAWELGAKSDPISMYMADIYTVLANLCGLPSVNIPQESPSESPMPFGIQLIGRHFDEAGMCALAEELG